MCEITTVKRLKLTSNCSAGRMCLQCMAAAVCCAICRLPNLRRKQIQALIECESVISGNKQKSQDFESIQDKLVTCSISTES